jgi:hypothetical protein
MQNKTGKIILNALPVALMIGLIPAVSDDYRLALVYVLITATAFIIRREEHDFLAYVFGLIVITASEYFFIQTGVETFVRRSLFGIMPVWLPLLWAYAFVAIKRSLRILDR